MQKLPHLHFALGLRIELFVVILILCGIHEDEPWTKTYIYNYGWDILYGQEIGKVDIAKDASVGTSLPISMSSAGYKGPRVRVGQTVRGMNV